MPVPLLFRPGLGPHQAGASLLGKITLQFPPNTVVPRSQAEPLRNGVNMWGQATACLMWTPHLTLVTI